MRGKESYGSTIYIHLLVRLLLPGQEVEQSKGAAVSRDEEEGVR